jgi:hypothetical protein
VLPDDGLAHHVVAQVIRAREGRIELGLQEGERAEARCAFSCLVAPRDGDTISAVRDARGGFYVTAILERPEPGELEIFSERAMTIRSAAGVTVAAATELQLDAGARIALKTPVLDALVGRIGAFARAVCVTAGEALLRTRVASFCGELLDVAAQRLTVTAEHSHRQIDGTEQIRCRTFDLQSGVAHVRADTALVKARDLVKMDAAQIQIG